MKKLILLALTIIICACSPLTTSSNPPQTPTNITASESNLTRAVIIKEDSGFYQTPTSWDTVPQKCFKSLTKIWLYDTDLNYYQSGSGSLIQVNKVQNNSGETLWVYYILTADHVVKKDVQVDQVLGSKILLFPGNYKAEDLNFGYLSYSQLLDEKNTKQDSGIISIFSLGENSNVTNESFVALGSENLISENFKQEIPQFYFGFGYPSGIENPQYTISTVEKMEDGVRKISLLPLEDFSNVTRGNSGGPICNKYDQNIGVAVSVNTNSLSFVAETNARNIQEQFGAAVIKTQEILLANGFK